MCFEHYDPKSSHISLDSMNYIFAVCSTRFLIFHWQSELFFLWTCGGFGWVTRFSFCHFDYINQSVLNYRELFAEAACTNKYRHHQFVSIILHHSFKNCFSLAGNSLWSASALWQCYVTLQYIECLWILKQLKGIFHVNKLNFLRWLWVPFVS